MLRRTSHPIAPDTALVRGCLGGRAPALVPIDRLLETAAVLPERRASVRRLGPMDRRKRRNNDRRGATAAWIPARGRRRADAISWQEDLDTVRTLTRMAARISGPSGRAVG